MSLFFRKYILKCLRTKGHHICNLASTVYFKNSTIHTYIYRLRDRKKYDKCYYLDNRGEEYLGILCTFLTTFPQVWNYFRIKSWEEMFSWLKTFISPFWNYLQKSIYGIYLNRPITLELYLALPNNSITQLVHLICLTESILMML